MGGCIVHVASIGCLVPIVNEYCALGAAHAAIGGGSHTEVATAAHVAFRGRGAKAGEIVNVMQHDEEWTDVFYRVFVCPECSTSRSLSELIPHLNDRHRWTREQIANFVETLEQQAGLALVVVRRSRQVRPGGHSKNQRRSALM